MKDLRLTAVLNDQVSKGIDALGIKIKGLSEQLKSEGGKQADQSKKAAEKLIGDLDKREKQRIAMQRASIALEERVERERGAIQTRAAVNALRGTKSQADATLRIERQASIAQASLILDKFDRRIGIERAKHGQILADLKGNDAAIEAELRRHQAVVSRVQMDKGNFANTPFQKMLESFNKLNNGLGRLTPAIGQAAGGLATAGGAAGAFGGALTSLALGPMGIAIAAATALSAGLNAIIASADRAATLKADQGSLITDPEKLKQGIQALQDYERAKASAAKAVGNGVDGSETMFKALEAKGKAAKAVKGIFGESAEDMRARGTTASSLRAQQASLKKVLEFRRINNEDGKRLDDELANARVDGIQNESKRLLTAEENRYAAQKLALGSHKENQVKAEALHALKVDQIRTDAALKAREDAAKAVAEDLAFQDASIANAAKREEKYQKDLVSRRAQASTNKKSAMEDEEKTKELYAKKDQERDEQRRQAQDKSIAATAQMFGGLAALSAQANMKDRSNRLRWKAMAMAEAGINMGRGIMQVVADRTLPTLAKIPAAIGIGAFGLAQINQIKDQKFYAGGYTGSGNPRDVAGIVHKDEYVVPHGDLARMGGPAGMERMLQGKGSSTSVHAPITINVSGNADAKTVRAIGETLEQKLKAHAWMNREVAYRGISA